LCDPAILPLQPGHAAHERAFWLLGGETLAEGSRSVARSLASNPVSGVFSFFEHGETTRLVLRTGPALDVETMSGHMHADLMSVYLVYKSTPLVVDAGTYSYRYGVTPALEATAPANWREYLSGPNAHNGVVIDNHDPLGQVTGDFRTGPSQARARLTYAFQGEALNWVEAEIVSPPPYASFVRGVVHVKGEYFLVYNLLAPEMDPLRVTFPLQLDPHVAIETRHDHGLRLAAGGNAIAPVVFSGDLTLAAQYHGQFDPPRGWVSPAYGVLRPAVQLVFRPAAADRGSAFAFGLNEHAAPMSIATNLLGGSCLVLELTGPNFRDWVFVNRGAAEGAVSYAGVNFTGRLLWLRASAAGEGEMRAVGCAACIAPALALDFQADAVEDNVALRWRVH
jgi:hypothetical protein